MSDSDAKLDELEQQYREITSLYDMAEELASTVESEFVQDPEAQMMLIEPLMSAVADSTDVLAQEYVNILENPSRKKSAKGRIESALRKMFMALEEYRSQVGLRSKKLLTALVNIADPVVDKISAQARKLTVLFLQLVEVSLERIMHKYELEEFRRNNEKQAVLPQLGH